MNVAVKNFTVSMDVKNKGIELQVNDTSGKQLGDLIVTKSKLTWCNGRTTAKNGKSISWTKFIEMINEL